MLVLALFRQVGVLEARLGPRAALELAEEGPPLGRPAPPLLALERTGPELVSFASPGCRLCAEIAPALRALERDGLTVHAVNEGRDAEAFAAYAVPALRSSSTRSMASWPPRAWSTRWSRSRSSSRSARAGCVPRPDERVERAARGLSRHLAERATRRSFLATVAGAALAVVGVRASEGRAAVRGSERTRAGWFGFCGHTWTTGSCPSPFTLPRVQRARLSAAPLRRPAGGQPGPPGRRARRAG